MIWRYSIVFAEVINEREKNHTESSGRQIALFQDAPEGTYEERVRGLRDDLGAIPKRNKVRNSKTALAKITKSKTAGHSDSPQVLCQKNISRPGGGPLANRELNGRNLF